MQQKIKLHDMAFLYFLKIQKEEGQGAIAHGSANHIWTLLTNFVDFIEKRKYKINELEDIPDSDLASFYHELKKKSITIKSVLIDLKFVAGFLIYLEKSGFFRGGVDFVVLDNDSCQPF